MPTKKSNITKRTKKTPALSAEQKTKLDAVVSMPDERIDYSDAPALPDAAWMNWMKAVAELPQTTQQITLRIDTEVLAFFKQTGKRYKSRINAVLRSYVKAHKAQR